MRIPEELRARLAAVGLLALDVDGVLTEGHIIYSDAGAETKAFHVRDGLGLRVAAAADLPVALITGRASPVLERRAGDLRIQHLLARVGDKAAALRTLAAELGLPLGRVAFMGDDLNDREAMGLAGVSLAPADAAPEVRDLADLVTSSPGGRGAAREAVEAILRAQGRWEQAVDAYLAGLADTDP